MSSSIHYFKALADETRLRLLCVLNRHELNVNELVIILEMGQSRISRHLKILSSSGLLTWRREGLWVFYSAADQGEPRKFIDALLPFLEREEQYEADLSMASGLIDERALTTRQFFNSIAEDWDKLSQDVLGLFDLPSAISRRMPMCDTAVDLGCGTGNVLSSMLEKADCVIGVDGSARMLELARRRFAAEADRVSLRIGDLTHLPLRDGEASFATINMVLHHLPSPADVLAETWRILAPGGRLVLTDFNRHDDERMRSDYGDHWLGFDLPTLVSHLERAGFAVSESELARVERGLSLHILTAERLPANGDRK